MTPDPKQKRDEPAIPDPQDVIDGIPDRTSRPKAWKFIALAIVFLAWLGVLLYYVRSR